MKLDICHVKISFETRYQSNMLKDTTSRLKTSECSSVTAFEKTYLELLACVVFKIFEISRSL
jgi:hypothetical protein